MPQPTCPTCRVPMEEGFMIDRGHHNVTMTAEWVKGIPERTWWSGVRLKGKERLPAVTYHCTRCGLLQSYARANVT